MMVATAASLKSGPTHLVQQQSFTKIFYGYILKIYNDTDYAILKINAGAEQVEYLFEKNEGIPTFFFAGAIRGDKGLPWVYYDRYLFSRVFLFFFNRYLAR
ncbi:hypothetical protein [Desulfogranum marinum]|uniref:hypothetical protein n=1 Tax=Desulfogranum marinum TaxID=453220 RepID=UPI0019657AA1|nr:hypothetical protein [Desulfogranum marinum]MBM9511469.1 hypothetical protein [Desulfogranum marinum]